VGAAAAFGAGVWGLSQARRAARADALAPDMQGMETLAAEVAAAEVAAS
jgi:hypothetical protein